VGIAAKMVFVIFLRGCWRGGTQNRTRIKFFWEGKAQSRPRGYAPVQNIHYACLATATATATTCNEDDDDDNDGGGGGGDTMMYTERSTQ